MNLNLNNIILVLLISFMGASVYGETDLENKGNRYAVVIGVSKYPNLKGGLDLTGPRNDAILMYQMLQNQGIQAANIQLLTEDHPAAKTPTKQAILDSLNSVLAKTVDGDFLYLHFSGHGSQQPSANPESEIDGLDEIFLPTDTKNWHKQTGHVENSISDNEVANYLQKFREKGVFVWLVFDSCHSATMTRSTVKMRKVLPHLLGIPSSRSNTRSNTSQRTQVEQPIQTTADKKSSKPLADYVAFFAAQSNEETPEMSFPANQDDAPVYGLFTYQILSAMSNTPDASYQQIAEQVMHNYAAKPWYGTTPLFVGSGLSAKVLGNRSSKRADDSIKDHFRINRTEHGYDLAIGSLHGLSEGATLLLLKQPSDSNEKALGNLKAVDVVPFSSRLQLLENKPNIKLPQQAWARLISRGSQPSISIRIAGDLASSNVTSKLMHAFKAEGILNRNIEWTNETADIYFHLDEEHIILSHADLTIDDERYPNSLKLKSNVSLAELQTATDKLIRALFLIRVGSQISSDALATELIVERDGKQLTFQASDQPKLYNGDKLSLKVANYLDLPLDITVLFVGSGFDITPIFPRKGQFNRFQEEEEKVIRLGRVNDKTLGTERLIIIGRVADNSSTMSDFSYLAAKSAQNKRRARLTPLDKQLIQRVFGTPSSTSNAKARTGSSQAAVNSSQTDIHTLSWITSKR